MRINSKFFKNRSGKELAIDLLGKVIVCNLGEKRISAIINELELYTQDDKACHAYKGKKTKRNELMFWRYGHLYVYFTYGMHYCANIVCANKGKAEAILIRSIKIIEGEEIARERRKTTKNSKGLSDGPAKLCQVLGINLSLNGLDLLDKKNTKLYLEDKNYKPKKVIKTTRIGISKDKERLWRFYSQEFL